MPKLKIKSENRPYTIYPNDFIDCEEILTANEKLICFILFRYGERAFPSLKTLSQKSGLSKKTVQRVINSLEDKKILSKEHRQNKKSGNQSNLYYLHDNTNIWKSKTIEELKTVIKETELEEAIEILKDAGYTVIKDKEKEPTSIPAKVTDVSTQISNIDKNITKKAQSQDLERYTMDDIRQLFDYDIMAHDNPYQQQDIDSVMDILYTALNTTKPNIRICGEDRPSMVVIGKLMKLNYESIMYTIKKFSEQTERISNPVSYMLTMLYNAPEQFRLDIQNQVSHDMAHWYQLNKK